MHTLLGPSTEVRLVLGLIYELFHETHLYQPDVLANVCYVCCVSSTQCAFGVSAMVEYKSISGKTLQESIESEMSGKLEELLVAIGMENIYLTLVMKYLLCGTSVPWLFLSHVITLRVLS